MSEILKMKNALLGACKSFSNTSDQLDLIFLKEKRLKCLDDLNDRNNSETGYKHRFNLKGKKQGSIGYNNNIVPAQFL